MNPRSNPTPLAILVFALVATLFYPARAAVGQSAFPPVVPPSASYGGSREGYFAAHPTPKKRVPRGSMLAPRVSTGPAPSAGGAPALGDGVEPIDVGMRPGERRAFSPEPATSGHASLAWNRGVLSAPPAADADSVTPPLRQPVERDFGLAETGDVERFSGEFSSGSRRFDVGVDFYSPPNFEGGLIIVGRDVAMKIGGYVKADFIYDFDPIDETDSFVTTSIPVGAPHRTNARFHARQTRLSFDTRWAASERTVRIFVEGDFFSDRDRFRLRHAYGDVGPLLVGQTWTTFTDVAAAPATLDFEGSVSAVNRRQAQARWTQPIFCDDLTVAIAVEDTRFIIETPVGITADPRSPSPDFVGHVRLEREWGRFQVAGLYRIAGVQPTGDKVYTGSAWGLNFTGVLLLSRRTDAYYQIVFGDGIGSYRGLPDAAPTAADDLALLPLFGWMVGITHNWTDRLSSNFTYAENRLDNTAFQLPDDVHRTTYLAANLIWKPFERVRVGIEYLYGLREDVDGAVGPANRLQAAFIFDLP